MLTLLHVAHNLGGPILLQQNMGEEGKTAEPVTDTKIYRGGIILCFREISSTEENNFLLVDEALSKGVIVYFYSGKSTQCWSGIVLSVCVCVCGYVRQSHTNRDPSSGNMIGRKTNMRPKKVKLPGHPHLPQV